MDGDEIFSMRIDAVSERGFFSPGNLVYIVAGGAGCVIVISAIVVIAVACARRAKSDRRRYQRTEISMGPFPPQELEMCAGEYSDARVHDSRGRYRKQAVQNTPHAEVLSEFVRLSPPTASVEQGELQWEGEEVRESGPLGDEE